MYITSRAKNCIFVHDRQFFSGTRLHSTISAQCPSPFPLECAVLEPPHVQSLPHIFFTATQAANHKYHCSTFLSVRSPGTPHRLYIRSWSPQRKLELHAYSFDEYGTKQRIVTNGWICIKSGHQWTREPAVNCKQRQMEIETIQNYTIATH